MDRDFELFGRNFKLNKIDAFKQFHIVRRIGPILSELLPAMQEVSKVQNSNQSEEEKLATIAKFATPIMTGLSKLSDNDANQVLHGLLQAVEIKQMPAGNWARVSNGELLLMQDLELPMLLQIAGKAFMFNLSGFFAALPQK